MSVLSGILDAIVTVEQAAARTIAGNALTVVKRKLPKAEDTVDADYQVTVSGAERPELITRLAFGGVWQVNYLIEITLISPAADALTNLDAVTDWRQAVRAAYMANGTLTAAGVKRVDPEDGTLFDRFALVKGFDYDQVVLSCWTYERR